MDGNVFASSGDCRALRVTAMRRHSTPYLVLGVPTLALLYLAGRFLGGRSR